MNCPSCGAPMRLAAATRACSCDYCKTDGGDCKADDSGVQFLDEAPEHDVPDVRGGVCGTRCWRRVKLNACKKCHGLLVRDGHIWRPLIEKMRAAASRSGRFPAPADPADLERKVDMPAVPPADGYAFLFRRRPCGDVDCERCEAALAGWRRADADCADAAAERRVAKLRRLAELGVVFKSLR